MAAASMNGPQQQPQSQPPIRTAVAIALAAGKARRERERESQQQAAANQSPELTPLGPAPDSILLIRGVPDNDWYQARDVEKNEVATLYLDRDNASACVIRRGGIDFVETGARARAMRMLAKTGHAALPLLILGRIPLTCLNGGECD